MGDWMIDPRSDSARRAGAASPPADAASPRAEARSRRANDSVALLHVLIRALHSAGLSSSQIRDGHDDPHVKVSHRGRQMRIRMTRADYWEEHQGVRPGRYLGPAFDPEGTAERVARRLADTTAESGLTRKRVTS